MARRKKKRRVPTSCPCGSGSSYRTCCRPFTTGELIPDEPETLMRSRYTAYALEKVDYIIDTTLPNSDAWEDDEELWCDRIKVFSQSCEFHGVEILDAPAPNENEGEVEFKAHLTENGRDVSFVERSMFTRIDEKWHYAGGQRIGAAR